MKRFFVNLWIKFCLKVISPLEWTWFRLFLGGQGWKLYAQDFDDIKKFTSAGPYIILSRRNTHFTTYCIGLANLWLTGRVGYWSHAFLAWGEDAIEAVGEGVRQIDINEALKVDAICVLRPLTWDKTEWFEVFNEAIKNKGKKYDSLFNLADDSEMSCVELVRDALMQLPDYHTRFARFEAMIKKENNLTPQMYYDCPDFKIVYEMRR